MLAVTNASWLSEAYVLIVLFFFQAEDGIRDLTVTGVQTCALPICNLSPVPSEKENVMRSSVQAIDYVVLVCYLILIAGIGAYFMRFMRVGTDFLKRSEERRVGKECRSRWSPYH